VNPDLMTGANRVGDTAVRQLPYRRSASASNDDGKGGDRLPQLTVTAHGSCAPRTSMSNHDHGPDDEEQPHSDGHDDGELVLRQGRQQALEVADDRQLDRCGSPEQLAMSESSYQSTER